MDTAPWEIQPSWASRGPALSLTAARPTDLLRDIALSSPAPPATFSVLHAMSKQFQFKLVLLGALHGTRIHTFGTNLTILRRVCGGEVQVDIATSVRVQFMC